MENKQLVSLLEDEKIEVSIDNISIEMKNNQDQILSYTNGTLQITDQRVIWFSEEHKKSMFFLYQDCISHGLQKTKMICFLSDNSENEDDEEEQEEDELYTMIKKCEIIDDENLQRIFGNYEVGFDFDKIGKETQDKVFHSFAEQSALNEEDDQNEQNDNYLANDFDLGEMITADDIDENGNVKLNAKHKLEENEEDDGEEIDENDIEIDDNMIIFQKPNENPENIQNKENNDKKRMEIE